MAISTRAATFADVPLVFDSFWRECIKLPQVRGATPKTLIAQMHRLIDDHWAVTVAHDTEVASEIMAWVAHRPGAVAWVFTKPTYQRKGVAGWLLRQIGVEPGRVISPFPGRWPTMKFETLYRPYLAIKEED